MYDVLIKNTKSGLLSTVLYSCVMCLLRINESAAVSLVIITCDVYRAADKLNV